MVLLTDDLSKSTLGFYTGTENSQPNNILHRKQANYVHKISKVHFDQNKNESDL